MSGFTPGLRAPRPPVEGGPGVADPACAGVRPLLPGSDRPEDVVSDDVLDGLDERDVLGAEELRERRVKGVLVGVVGGSPCDPSADPASRTGAPPDRPVRRVDRCAGCGGHDALDDRSRCWGCR